MSGDKQQHTITNAITQVDDRNRTNHADSSLPSGPKQAARRTTHTRTVLLIAFRPLTPIHRPQNPLKHTQPHPTPHSTPHLHTPPPLTKLELEGHVFDPKVAVIGRRQQLLVILRCRLRAAGTGPRQAPPLSSSNVRLPLSLEPLLVCTSQRCLAGTCAADRKG